MYDSKKRASSSTLIKAVDHRHNKKDKHFLKINDLNLNFDQSINTINKIENNSIKFKSNKSQETKNRICLIDLFLKHKK